MLPSSLLYFLILLLLRADAAESFLPHKIMVVPFAAYALDEAGFVTKHHSCRTTIILHDGKWSDQPFDELVMDDIVGIGSDPELDDMLCIKIGSTVHRRRDTAKIDREKKNFAVGLAESFWFFTANLTREMYEMTRIHSFNQAHFRDFYSCDKNYTREPRGGH